jgi:ribosomal protein L7/L12
MERDVFELRQRVEKLERQVAALFAHLNLQYEDRPTSAVSPEILALVRRGRKIEAIKRYREETGVGLREAKNFIESLDE